MNHEMYTSETPNWGILVWFWKAKEVVFRNLDNHEKPIFHSEHIFEKFQLHSIYCKLAKRFSYRVQTETGICYRQPEIRKETKYFQMTWMNIPVINSDVQHTQKFKTSLPRQEVLELKHLVE